MKRIVIILLILTGIAAITAAQTPGSGPFRQEGIASWYGEEFNGRPTASGEIFDASLFTAAHPRLPFGTLLTVTNTHNNRQVIVRVNDRGPFVAARIIDVSRAAAEALDMVVTGTAPVIIEEVVAVAHPPAPVVTPPPAPIVAAPAPPLPAPAPAPIVAPAPPPPAHVVTAPTPALPAPAPPAEIAPVAMLLPEVQPPAVPAPVVPAPDPLPLPVLPPQAIQAVPPPQAPPAFIPAPPAVLTGTIPMPGSTRLYRIQVGSYTIPRNAVEAFDRLRNAGLSPAYERHYERQINFYRVVLPGLRADEIQRAAQILGNAGFREALIRVEN